MLRISPPLTVVAAATVATLLAQPALARAHVFSVHRPIDQWHHYRHAIALRHRHAFEFHHRFARVYWRRDTDIYAYEPQQRFSETNSFSAPWHNSFSAPWRGGGYGPQGFGQPTPPLHGMAEAAASANGVPVSLVDRVIRRESGGNARAASRGNYGLMQIRLGTARSMGYEGSAAGLLDPQTNLTYAVRYLAGAYRAAGGNENRAVALYARGYNGARVQFASYSASQPAGAYRGYRDYSPAVPRRRGYMFSD